VRTSPVGDGGHGYDPVFQPDDADRSSAELTRAEKNALSHRAKAFRGIAPIVREYFAE
jgi:XTP/dITP diphosphohydrolase